MHLMRIGAAHPDKSRTVNCVLKLASSGPFSSNRRSRACFSHIPIKSTGPRYYTRPLSSFFSHLRATKCFDYFLNGEFQYGQSRGNTSADLIPTDFSKRRNPAENTSKFQKFPRVFLFRAVTGGEDRRLNKEKDILSRRNSYYLRHFIITTGIFVDKVWYNTIDKSRY